MNIKIPMAIFAIGILFEILFIERFLKMRAYERFLNYAKLPTMSDEDSPYCPSTAKQLALAELLKEELLELGLSDARVDEHGYVYATLPANTNKVCPNIGFIAHMDTSPDASDENIKPKLVKYCGGDILLNEEKNIWLRESDYPRLKSYTGHTLITSDGTTLIGGDDKCGIAEIMTMLEILINANIPHGKISVGFTPDEEIGRGADLFDVEAFGADFAYTVDGGAIGELEYENFNAASAKVKINGVSIHPGAAKGKMKNAARIACEFDRELPQNEIPEKTSGYEGFHHLTGMEGACETATFHYIIRDHDMEKFENKKRDFLHVGELINERYGDGVCEIEIKDSYFNMKEKIEPCMHIIDRARSAMKELSIEPIITPIRGGTDGARLSFMGLPCPNLGTGSENAHSRFEYASCEDMDKISELLAKIAGVL